VIRYAAGRLAITVPILLAVSFATFWAAGEISSPAAQLTLNPRISPEARRAYVESLGLDEPFGARYLTWLGDFVTGDLGTSLVRNGAEVWPLLRTAMANTLLLVVVAVAVSLGVGLAAGTLSALRPDSVVDRAVTTVSFVGISIPVFWLGLMLQLLFGLYLTEWLRLGAPLLPTAGIYSPGRQGFDLLDRARHLVLPVVALSFQLVAAYSRYMRSSMLEVMGMDYISAARAKGLSEGRVVVRHGVRNALIPVTTLAAVDLGLLVGGLIVTERVFQYPGMGLLFLDSLNAGDYPVLLATVMIVSAAVFLMNMLADLLYAVFDPRIRYG